MMPVSTYAILILIVLIAAAGTVWLMTAFGAVGGLALPGLLIAALILRAVLR